MGADRFECYVNAAKMALMQNPRNDVLKKDQKLKNDTEVAEYHSRMREINKQRRQALKEKQKGKREKEEQRNIPKGKEQRGTYRTTKGPTGMRGARHSTQRPLKSPPRNQNAWRNQRSYTSPRQRELDKFRSWDNSEGYGDRTNSLKYHDRKYVQSDWADQGDSAYYRERRSKNLYDSDGVE